MFVRQTVRAISGPFHVATGRPAASASASGIGAPGARCAVVSALLRAIGRCVRFYQLWRLAKETNHTSRENSWPSGSSM